MSGILRLIEGQGMQPFVCEKGVVAFIEGRNIDTDQILPGRFLKSNRSEGYGRFLFHDLRFQSDGTENEGFVLNLHAFRAAKILVTEENFGCGSSREGAVYALADYGIRALIGPSFGDIFFSNCLKNGIVPVRIEAEEVGRLSRLISDAPGCIVSVDLEALRVEFPDQTTHEFDIDGFWRDCLLQGVDDLQLTLGYGERINAFIGDYYKQAPWAK